MASDVIRIGELSPMEQRLIEKLTPQERKELLVGQARSREDGRLMN